MTIEVRKLDEYRCRYRTYYLWNWRAPLLWWVGFTHGEVLPRGSGFPEARQWLLGLGPLTITSYTPHYLTRDGFYDE